MENYPPHQSVKFKGAPSHRGHEHNKQGENEGEKEHKPGDEKDLIPPGRFVFVWVLFVKVPVVYFRPAVRRVNAEQLGPAYGSGFGSGGNGFEVDFLRFFSWSPANFKAGIEDLSVIGLFVGHKLSARKVKVIS